MDTPAQTLSAHAPTAVGDLDLLATLLGPAGPSPAAVAAWLEGLGGWRPLTRRGVRRLARSLEGLVEQPERDAARLVAALELGRRLARPRLDVGAAIGGVRDVEHHVRHYLDGRCKEAFLVLLLDAKHRLLATEVVSEGCLTWSIVHPREVFVRAVDEQAGAVLAAHNHPSGDPTPSAEDLEVTRRLGRAGRILGIPLLDHVVVGARRCTSLRAEGYLDELEDQS